MVETEAKDNIDRARTFIEHLQLYSGPTDLMQLRRLLHRAEYSATIPLVEEYLNSARCKDPWERQVHSLVAGLWARALLGYRNDLARKEVQPEQAGEDRSLGQSTAKVYLAFNKDMRIEHIFLDLLEAETQQLPHQLNQAMIWLSDRPEASIHWPELLADLLAWNQEGRPTQQKWARDFNRTVKEGDQRFQGLGKS
jgi:CRISPR type I-E-associated protein CasB/Cse2